MTTRMTPMVHRIEILNTNPAMRRTIPRRILAVTSSYSEEVPGAVRDSAGKPSAARLLVMDGHRWMRQPNAFWTASGSLPGSRRTAQTTPPQTGWSQHVLANSLARP